jgi:predicted transcriptional regulator
MIDFACKKFELEEVIRCGFGITKSDYRIIVYLMKNTERFNSNDISKNLELDLSTVQRSLKKLNEKNLIIRSQINLANGGYVYFYSIKDKKEIKEMLTKIINNWSEKVKSEVKRW